MPKEEIQTRVTKVLKTILKEEFSHPFQQLYKWTQGCFTKHGDYNES